MLRGYDDNRIIKKESKVKNKTKKFWNKTKSKAGEISKKEINYSMNMPRWAKVIVLPVLFCAAIVLITDNEVKYNMLNETTKVSTLGFVSFDKDYNFGKITDEEVKTYYLWDQEENNFKPINVNDYDENEENYHYKKRWNSIFKISPQITNQQITEQTDNGTFIWIYTIVGIVFYTVLLAFFASFSDSKRTTALVRKYTGESIRIRLKNNIKINQNEIEQEVKEKIKVTEFWQTASLQNSNYKVWQFPLVIPVLYRYAKSLLFTNGFIGNEFELYWKLNVEDWNKEEIINETQNTIIDNDINK